MGYDALFEPHRLAGCELPNRIVMAPMTRTFSPGGVPGPEVAAYYRRRAEGGVGLIITEGTWINHPAASNDDMAPRFHGDDALSGLRIDAVAFGILPDLHRARDRGAARVHAAADGALGVGDDNALQPDFQGECGEAFSLSPGLFVFGQQSYEWLQCLVPFTLEPRRACSLAPVMGRDLLFDRLPRLPPLDLND